jgi:hypothetical protein
MNLLAQGERYGISYIHVDGEAQLVGCHMPYRTAHSTCR